MAKTTIEISDGLLIKAKKLAAETRQPLRRIFENALQNHLRKGSKINKPQKTTRSFPWKTVDGGLPEGLNIGSRDELYRWISTQKK